MAYMYLYVLVYCEMYAKLCRWVWRTSILVLHKHLFDEEVTVINELHWQPLDVQPTCILAEDYATSRAEKLFLQPQKPMTEEAPSQ